MTESKLHKHHAKHYADRLRPHIEAIQDIYYEIQQLEFLLDPDLHTITDDDELELTLWRLDEIAEKGPEDWPDDVKRPTR